MSKPLDQESGSMDGVEPDSHSGNARKIVAGVLVCVLAIALGIAFLMSSQSRDEAAAGPSTTEATPSEPAPTSAATPDAPATGSPATEASPPASPATGEAPTESTPPAEEEPDTAGDGAEEPAQGEAGTDGAPHSPPDHGTNDAKQATIEQPVSEPVELEEPSEVGEGVTASVTGLEAIQGEAFGIGEIAGPALRFVITVENSTEAAVSLSNAVVNVEYGEENLPAVQLTGSGATEFQATVEAGGSASTTLVFAIPANQRDSLRILLNIEASSPIAAFEGAAPGEKG